MIKTWYKFNENTDNLKSVGLAIGFTLTQKLSEVREIFYELEDLGIIQYSILVSGYERGGASYFNPKLTTKMGDINEYIDYITPTVKFGLNKDVRFHDGKRIRNTPDERLLILIDIKLPGESNEFGSTVIGNDGIDLFDDIISGVNRLKDLGYNVKLDFNANHHEYKPLKILAYFDI